MKGYELYSWQANGKWYFSFLPGTNRLKTFDEISAPEVVFTTMSEFGSRLEKLEPGAEIVWNLWADPRFSLPPQAVVDEIKKMCRELGLSLTVASE